MFIFINNKNFIHYKKLNMPKEGKKKLKPKFLPNLDSDGPYICT